MASGHVTAPMSVPDLMGTVKRLTPSELRRFQRAFARWQKRQNEQSQEDAALVEACTVRLAPADERRLRNLIGKSERGSLSAKELADYRSLVQRAETVDATRLAALTQLAQRWDKSVREVMAIVGREDGKDATTRHPARRSQAGTRPRR